MGQPHVVSSTFFRRDRPIKYHRHYFFSEEFASLNMLALPHLSGCGPSRIISNISLKRCWANSNILAAPRRAAVGRHEFIGSVCWQANPMISSASPPRKAGPILHYRNYLIREVLGQLEYIGSTASEQLWAIANSSAVCVGRPTPRYCQYLRQGELGQYRIIGNITTKRARPILHYQQYLVQVRQVLGQLEYIVGTAAELLWAVRGLSAASGVRYPYPHVNLQRRLWKRWANQMPSALLICRGVGQLEYTGIAASEHMGAITNSSVFCAGRPTPIYRQYLRQGELGQYYIIGNISLERCWANSNILAVVLQSYSGPSGVYRQHLE
jgi:hypothetical protein